MNQLRDSLENATQELKEKFLIQTAEWAAKEYDRLKLMSQYSELDWCKYFGLTPELVNAHVRLSQMPEAQGLKYSEAIKLIKYDPNLKLSRGEFWSMPSGFHNSKVSRRYYALKDEVSRIARIKREDYLMNAEKKAVRHYNVSLDKLVARLIAKGIKGGEPEIKRGWVGVNLEIVVKVGNIQVRAWTIVAKGEIQRPHYRYLVK